jgi:hypothetical protein
LASSGGKDRLGNISKRGDRYLRSLFMTGALAVIRYAKIHGTTHRPWLTALLTRRPTKVAAIALANKIARMAWAIMATTPRPSLTAGQTVFTYSGELTGVPAAAAPDILDKSYTITAEVEIPKGGAEGMIVTQGGRFGGYGLFLSKGVAGIRRGKVVFLYNLLDLSARFGQGRS